MSQQRPIFRKALKYVITINIIVIFLLASLVIIPKISENYYKGNFGQERALKHDIEHSILNFGISNSTIAIQQQNLPIDIDGPDILNFFNLTYTITKNTLTYTNQNAQDHELDYIVHINVSFIYKFVFFALKLNYFKISNFHNTSNAVLKFNYALIYSDITSNQYLIENNSNQIFDSDTYQNKVGFVFYFNIHLQNYDSQFNFLKLFFLGLTGPFIIYLIIEFLKYVISIYYFRRYQ